MKDNEIDKIYKDYLKKEYKCIKLISELGFDVATSKSLNKRGIGLSIQSDLVCLGILNPSSVKNDIIVYNVNKMELYSYLDSVEDKSFSVKNISVAYA